MNTDFIIKPLIYPKCHPDEFPTGYLIRLAELNRYQSANWLVNSSSPVTGVRSARYFHNLLLASPWTDYQKNKNSCLAELHNRYFDMRHMRFCPLCIKEFPYVKTIWQMKTSYVCRLHGVWLRNSCTKCKSRIAVDSPTLIYCKCGHWLLDQEVLLACIELQNIQAFVDGDLLINEFTEDLKSRLDLVMFFNRWLRFKGKEEALGYCEFSREALSDAAKALFGGRDGIFIFLTRLKKLGEVYLTRFRNQFYERYPGENFSQYRTFIEEYINENWERPLTQRNSNLRSETLLEHPWVPFSIACRQYGICKIELRKAFLSGDVRYKTKKTKKRTFTYIYKPDIQKHLSKIKNIVTLKEARSVLGLSKGHFLELANNKFFRKSLSPAESGLGTWCFSLEEMHTLRKKLAVVTNNTSNDTWSFSEIMKYFSGQIDDFLLNFTKSILDKSLKIESRDITKNGFASLRFSKIDFASWLSCTKQSEHYLSVPMFAKMLGIHQQFAYELVHQGIIECSFFRESRNVCISRSHLSDFQNKYVLLSKLSKASNLSSRTLISFFDYRGIKSVDATFEKPLRQKIYLKECLQNIAIISEYVMTGGGKYQIDDSCS